MGLLNWFFGRMCRQVFTMVDHDQNGKLSEMEIELAVLQVFNIINKRFPGWQNPPTRKQIQLAFIEFDTNLSGSLEPAEFEAFVRSLVRLGPKAMMARMGRRTVIQSALLPAATLALQRAVGGAVGRAPLHMLAPFLGIAGAALRAFTPW